MDSSIGNDNKVFVLENSIAVLADLDFSSGVHSTIPNAFFDLAKSQTIHYKPLLFLATFLYLLL